MNSYHALRHLRSQNGPQFKAGDVLVLFGELFQRGYANGLVEEAERRGMKIIYTTVGRREKDGVLRALNTEELANMPKPFINIPLEAGFDMEPDDQGVSLVEHLKDVKLSDWESFELPAGALESMKKKGRARFTKNVREYLIELKSHLPAGTNVLFAHLMAGGVPRAKIIMPLMNRVVKGTGDRFLSSEKLSRSGIGKAMLESFFEVTAETFGTLVNETSTLRAELEKAGSQVSYLAYGYHGTEVLMGHEYIWQSYSPYLQGWAKMRLESLSQAFSKKGIHTCVYNCPEILTNSSSIFAGVEVSLYPLLGALQKESPGSATAMKTVKQCLDLLKPEFTLEKLLDFTRTYLTAEVIRSNCIFEKWPQHNNDAQMGKMLSASSDLVNMHKDTKELVTFVLSEVVFATCGKVMLSDIIRPEAPVSWINHDIIAKTV
jgi:hypothetical protein